MSDAVKRFQMQTAAYVVHGPNFWKKLDLNIVLNLDDAQEILEHIDLLEREILELGKFIDKPKGK